MNKSRFIFLFCLQVILTNLLLCGTVSAQDVNLYDYDTTYFRSYASKVTIRTYLSQKYTSLEIKNGNDGRLRYWPNSNLTLGLGASYKALTLNLSFGFPFLNPDKEKGKTTSIDLQTRLYGRKWATDFFGQIYKGYFLYPKGQGMADKNAYYIRPELKVTEIGISSYRMFNYKRFTLHPSFSQDECQMRSAGTFLAGADIYYSDFHSDSALVPVNLSLPFSTPAIRKVRLIQVGPGAGYGYTQVLPLHFFITASLTFNAGIAYTREYTTISQKNQVSLNPNYVYRLAAGFCNHSWNISFFHVNSRVATRGYSDNRYILNSGIYRLIVAKRLTPGNRGKRLLKPFDKATDILSKIL